MTDWSLEQHLATMRADSVVFRPRFGDGLSSPFREADGSSPVRDVNRERRAIEEYLAWLDPSYRARVAALGASIPPMSEHCALSVLAPSRNEAPCLPWFLELMAAQRELDGAPLREGRVEVLILLNRFASEPEDGSRVVVASWAVSYGGPIAVRTIDYLHPTAESAPLTMARKLLADVALYRAAQRQAWRRPLYLSCQDIDLVWIDPRESALIIASLDAQPGLDGVRGQQDRCPWILMRHPLLFAARRSWNFSEAYANRRSLRPDRNPHYDFNWNRLVTSGWNTGFTAEAYAEINGYSRMRRFKEDMDIGEKTSCLRGYEERSRFVPQTHTIGRIPTRSEGSCRRWIYSLPRREQPYDEARNYDNFFNERHEQIIKTHSVAELESMLEGWDRVDQSAIDALAASLTEDLRFLLRVGGEHGEREYRRVLRRLGFRENDYTIDGTALALHDVDGLLARVAAYATRAGATLPGMPPSRLPRGRLTWQAGEIAAVPPSTPAARSFEWLAGVRVPARGQP